MNMYLQRKIKSGALQYVLVVSVVIAIIVFAFISLIYLQQKLQGNNRFNKEIIHHTHLGFEYIRPGGLLYDEEQVVSFSENTLVKTSIKKSHWGVFDVITIASHIKNQVFKKTALIGSNDSNKDVLYLQENHQPLVLVGNTRITGDVNISKQGIKRGNIAGVSYTGNQLINGNIFTSSGQLPAIKNIDYLNDFYTNFTKGTFNILELEESMQLHQSFTNTTLLYENIAQLDLRNISLSGNIILQSHTKIVVHDSAKLQDVILIAPKIEVRSKTKGSFQAFASDDILIGEGCTLAYPTVLMVSENNEEAEQGVASKIIISKQTDLKGIVLFLSKNEESDPISQIQIDEKAMVTGEVYCQGNLELKGSVFGSVYTHHFITHASGGIYINHILNGMINHKKLPNQYCGLDFTGTHNKVVKWVE